MSSSSSASENESGPDDDYLPSDHESTDLELEENVVVDSEDGSEEGSTEMVGGESKKKKKRRKKEGKGHGRQRKKAAVAVSGRGALAAGRGGLEETETAEPATSEPAETEEQREARIKAEKKAKAAALWEQMKASSKTPAKPAASATVAAPLSSGSLSGNPSSKIASSANLPPANQAASNKFLSNQATSLPSRTTPAQPNGPGAPEKPLSAVELAMQILNQKKGLDQGHVIVTEKYDYAGEAIVVNKAVAADSKDALRAKSRSNLDDILDSLGGKRKMSTMGKSKLDWDQFKDKEGIAEELDQATKSKNGYLDKQAFIEQANYRQFELERDERLKRLMSRASEPPARK